MNTKQKTTDTWVYLRAERGSRERSRKDNYWVLDDEILYLGDEIICTTNFHGMNLPMK